MLIFRCESTRRTIEVRKQYFMVRYLQLMCSHYLEIGYGSIVRNSKDLINYWKLSYYQVKMMTWVATVCISLWIKNRREIIWNKIWVVTSTFWSLYVSLHILNRFLTTKGWVISHSNYITAAVISLIETLQFIFKVYLLPICNTYNLSFCGVK